MRKYPHIKLYLSDVDPNISFVLARVMTLFKRAGYPKEIFAEVNASVREADDYDAALERLGEWITLHDFSEDDNEDEE